MLMSSTGTSPSTSSFPCSCAVRLLLIFYGIRRHRRKHCWRCQRAVEGRRAAAVLPHGRDASRAQRVGLVVCAHDITVVVGRS